MQDFLCFQSGKGCRHRHTGDGRKFIRHFKPVFRDLSIVNGGKYGRSKFEGGGSGGDHGDPVISGFRSIFLIDIDRNSSMGIAEIFFLFEMLADTCFCLIVCGKSSVEILLQSGKDFI